MPTRCQWLSLSTWRVMISHADGTFTFMAAGVQAPGEGGRERGGEGRQCNISHCTYPVVVSLPSRQQNSNLISAKLACSCPYLMKCHCGMQTAHRPSLLLGCKAPGRLSAAGAAPLPPSFSATAEWTMHSTACTVSALATPGWWVSHNHHIVVTNLCLSATESNLGYTPSFGWWVRH